MENIFSTETVRNMRNRTTLLEREGDYWTEEEKEKLQDMFHLGMGLTEIAITLQRTESAVYQQIEKMDLYQRKTYPQKRARCPKAPKCLCETCTLPQALCPHAELYHSSEEGL